MFRKINHIADCDTKHVLRVFTVVLFIVEPFPSDSVVTLLCRVRQRFPVGEFNAVRALLDPKNIMANDHINSCLGQAK